MIPVTVAKMGLDSASKAYVVFLQERDGERALPIWIGRPEAEAIAAQLHGVRRERPMTHDLCQAIIVGLGAALRRVQVTHMHDGTYFAEMHLVRGASPVIVDARPSDAIAIALRLDAPIFVDESLLDDVEGAGTAGPSRPDDDTLSAEQLQHYLERLRPEDFGRFSL